VGLTWKAAESGTTKDLSVVIWADDRFIAVGAGGTVLKSPDGTSWTALESGITDDLRSVVWTGKRLVAVAADGKVLTSETGTAWTERGTNLEKHMRQVAWTGKFLSALGEEGYTGRSTDGITWTAKQSDKIYLLIPTAAVWTGNELVWVGYSSSTAMLNGGMAATTKDGVVFKDISPSYSCNGLYGAAWSGYDATDGLSEDLNGKLIGAGRNGEMFVMNYGLWDSGKWGEGYISTTDLNAVVWTGSEAVAVGEGGLILRSTTGHYRNWKTVSSPAGADLTSLAWNEDRLVAVGSAGGIITSP
jgi:hypothetical protein